MAHIKKIASEDLLFKYIIDDNDRKNEEPLLSAQMLQYIFLIREFERRVLDEYADKGRVHGPLHSSIGEEAVAIGTSASLKRADTITSTHRGHHHFLGKAFFYYLSDNYDPRTDAIPEKLKEICGRTMAEILGLEAGYSGGRGGSMHMADKESGVLGTNAIVAGGVAMGIIIAMTPTVGIQMILVVIIHTIIRVNRLAGIIMVYISNPLTLIPIYWLDYVVGSIALNRKFISIKLIILGGKFASLI